MNIETLKKLFETGKKKIDPEYRVYLESHLRSLGSITNFFDWMCDVVEKFNLNNSIILDVGCGWGEQSLFLSNHGNTIYALDKLDFVKPFIESFGRENLTYLYGNAKKIPLMNNSVDVVYVNEAISHINNVDKAMKEFIRVLKPQGRLIIMDSNKNCLSGWKTINIARAKIDEDCYKPLREKAFRKKLPHLDEESIKNLAKNTKGWSLEDIKTKWGTGFKPKFKWVSPVSGNFEENLFTPQEIIKLMRSYGFKAREIIVQPMPKQYSWPVIGKLFYWLKCPGKYYIEGVLT